MFLYYLWIRPTYNRIMRTYVNSIDLNLLSTLISQHGGKQFNILITQFYN